MDFTTKMPTNNTRNSLNSNPSSDVVLVTGGAGYIGSHACKALARAGYTPVVFDNLYNGHKWSVKWGPLEVGDLTDRFRLEQVMRTYKPIAVIHFAAFAYVGESVEHPGKYYRNNVVGTLNLLDVMRDFGVDQLIFSSTCASYGIPLHMPIGEDHPQDPINPYGASKLMVERIVKDYAHAYGLKSIFLRYFNAAGADPEGEIGEVHDPETHLIPLVLKVALKKLPDITLFGNDYDTPDGSCIRDYIHVSDLVDAHVLALNVLQQGRCSLAYNLGNGNGFSVLEVIDTAKKVTGCPIPVKIGPRREGDPAQLVANATKAYQELGWKPNHLKLEEIIKTAWHWEQKSQKSF